MPAGTFQSIVVCAVDGTIDFAACDVGTKAKLVQGYIIDTGAATFFDNLLLNGIVDLGAIQIGFSGIITLFVAGLSFGVIVGIVRKAR